MQPVLGAEHHPPTSSDFGKAYTGTKLLGSSEGKVLVAEIVRPEHPAEPFGRIQAYTLGSTVLFGREPENHGFGRYKNIRQDSGRTRSTTRCIALRRSPNAIEENGYECRHLWVEIAGTLNNPDIGELGLRLARQEP